MNVLIFFILFYHDRWSCSYQGLQWTCSCHKNAKSCRSAVWQKSLVGITLLGLLHFISKMNKITRNLHFLLQL